MSSLPSGLLAGDIVEAARQLTGEPKLRLLQVSAEPVAWRVVSEVTHGLRRLRGTSTNGLHTQSWSLILKTLQPDPAGDPVTGSDWEREALAYTSGLLHPVGGFRPARLLHLTRPAPDRIQLWLEDVPDDTPEVWPLGRHALAAHHLGEFNGAYPADPPQRPGWLWQNWWDSFDPAGDSQETRAVRLAGAWDRPLVRLAFPQPVRAELEQLEADYAGLTRAVGALPHTLCHLDPGRFNLRSPTRADGTPETVFLDWQSLGVGPLGADLAMMHFLNLCRFYADPAECGQLDEAGFAAYWRGVRSQRPGVSREEARLGYTAAAALRTATVVRLLVAELAAEGGAGRRVGQWGEKRGWSLEQSLEGWGQGMAFLLSLGAEARWLAGLS